MLSGVVAAGLLACAGPAPAHAQFPTPRDEAERAVLPELVRTVEGKADLAALDALLARLPDPTPLRGVVQAVRATQLLDAGRSADARRAAEEAVQLTPGMAAPRILAAYVLVFVGMPAAAADDWLEASVIDPEAARRSEPYELDAILGRLRDAGDYARADRMAARMDEIGIIAALAPARSATALARFRSTYMDQGADSARPILTSILSPDALYGLSLDRGYAAVWPDIDRWAGPGFAGVRLRYLTELRREWLTNRSMEAAVDYARALTGTRRFADIVRLFLPLFDASPDRIEDGQIAFLGPIVSRALLRTGRRAEGLALLRRIEAKVKLSGAAMALNLSAAEITQASDLLEWEQVAHLSERWLATARAIGPEVNQSAILQVTAMQACALHHTGHVGEAAARAAEVTLARREMPSSAFMVYGCRDDVASARLLFREMLSDPDGRNWGLALMQPLEIIPDQLPGDVASDAFRAKVAADPGLRALAAKVGRIMPRPLSTALPTDFDPEGPPPVVVLRPDSV